jgi:hexosaminidase
MRHLLTGILLCIAVLTGATAHAAFAIIPAPQHLTRGQGAFELHQGARIAAPADARAQWIAGFLRDAIETQTGVKLRVVAAPDRGRITLRVVPSIQGGEAYRLEVTPHEVTISAADERGLFWGVQTFRQLLPLQHEVPPAIPAVSIEDAPRYAWRGMMLDTARHFYPVDFIKQQIDLM